METSSDNIITKDILLRKGARKASEIPEHVHHLLQSGTIESVNLTEWLAVDHILLCSRLPDNSMYPSPHRMSAENWSRRIYSAA